MTLGTQVRVAIVAALLLSTATMSRADVLQAVDRPTELGFVPERLERITTTFQSYVDKGALPGAVVLIARHDKVVYLRAFGWQDRAKQVAMKADAIFRIASMTKPIVSV